MSFGITDINKKWILIYLNYKKESNSEITMYDFKVMPGKRYNGDLTVHIIPEVATRKFKPSAITEKYYNDVVKYIVSINRKDKINKILK